MIRLLLPGLLLVPFVSAPAAADTAGPPLAADLILLNAKVWTVDASRPEAEALAAWHGRLMAVGSNEEVRRLIGPDTRSLDAGGRRVVPGFYDSHVHVLGSGMRLAEVALKDAADEAEFGRRLRAFDAR